MSPPETSIPKPAMKSWSFFEDLYAQGNTIILVTHEEDIAEHARRVVRLRDGLLESDAPVANPRLATALV